MRWQNGPQQLERYNGYPSLTVSGMAAPGQSTGTALKQMEQIAREVMPAGMSFEWTGTAYEEQQAGGQIGLLLGLSTSTFLGFGNFLGSNTLTFLGFTLGFFGLTLAFGDNHHGRPGSPLVVGQKFH